MNGRILFSAGIIQHSLLNGKCSAGIGPVRINAATGFDQKRAGFFRILGHLQKHIRKKIGGSQDDIYIPIQKFV
jgi:hypothetical protein